MVNPIDIHKLTLEELSGVIALYPWYGGARMEFCRRMSGLGALSDSQIAETALHLGSRQILSRLVREGHAVDCSDKDARRIVAAFIPETARPEAPARRIHVVGGDYFSQEAYDQVARSDDNALRRAVASVREEPEERDQAAPLLRDGFCTETLAGIYAEQGYFGEAKQIYSKLLLAYPEKSVYFASLIEKMDLLLNN